MSGTISKSPELWEIAKPDNARWHHHVLPNIVPRRVEDFLRKKETIPQTEARSIATDGE